jgi:hypothetical protein
MFVCFMIGKGLGLDISRFCFGEFQIQKGLNLNLSPIHSLLL